MVADGDPDRKADGGEEPEETVLISGFDARTREVTVLKPSGEGLEASVLRPAEEGRPLQGDLVRLTPRPGFPMLAGLKTLLRHPDRRPGDDRAGGRPVAEEPRSHKGPPRVSSEAYRRGWEAVFGRGREEDPEAN